MKLLIMIFGLLWLEIQRYVFYIECGSARWEDIFNEKNDTCC